VRLRVARKVYRVGCWRVAVLNGDGGDDWITRRVLEYVCQDHKLSTQLRARAVLEARRRRYGVPGATPGVG